MIYIVLLKQHMNGKKIRNIEIKYDRTNNSQQPNPRYNHKT